ncbi:hypothetical protein A4X13_0g5514 [Tilletia indica]|uniref:VLRF1 domain-containing protein n=1 Tax=Tilletia indica TaxID=43049 RepID=A0A177TX24_9BASI|nr:hypothetical protein A4X13_0g5514 [Tilletia indica]
MASSSSSTTAGASAAGGAQKHPLLSAAPLYAFGLPVPLLHTVKTVQSVINEPYPSPHDIIVSSHHQYNAQPQQQQLSQTSQATDASSSSSFSIRFPKARSEATSRQLPQQSSNQSAADEDESSSDDNDEPPAYTSIGAGPNAPFIWLNSTDASLEQQHFGIHRSLFTLPPAQDIPQHDNADFPASHVQGLQLQPITRPKGLTRAVFAQNKHRGGVHAISGRAFKSQGVQEAARRLGFRVIEGADYIAGLGKIDSGVDEEGESSEEEVGGAGTDGTDEELPVQPRIHSDGEAEEEVDDAATTTAASTISKTSASLTPLQQSLLSSPQLKTWTLILLGGGDFAAAVIALNPFVELSPKLFPNGPPTPEQLLSIASTQPSSDRSVLLLAHKTIHRYTTRRKQGGSQSAQDASGKFAKSAGAQLRRYGEQSLRDDIRATLGSPGWRTLLAQTDRVWVRAGARAASGVLWNWPSGSAGQSPLDMHRASDTVVSIPVQTRKATLGECVRVWAELTRVRVRAWTAEEFGTLEEEVRVEREKGRAAAERRNRGGAPAAGGESAPSAVITRRKAVVLSDRERAGRDRFGRMVDMVRKGKVEVLVDFLSKYEDDLVKRGGGWGPALAEEGEVKDEDAERKRVDTPFPLWWRAQEAGIPLDEVSESLPEEGSEAPAVEAVPTSTPSTLLQLAADAGSEEIVQYLLIERRADPTAPILPLYRRTSTTTASNNAENTTVPHRTAYDLSHSRPVRDVFRRLMAEQPEWCDWASMGAGGARVPSALTGEMEEKRDGKVKERRNLMREKARARELAAAAKGPSESSSTPPPPPAAPAPKPSSSVSNRLGGGTGGTNAPSALRQAVDQSAGVTPEVRARIEREKRARAAEARMKALQGGAKE